MLGELVGVAVFSIGCGIVHSRIKRNMALREECKRLGHVWAEVDGYVQTTPWCVRCGHTPGGD